MWPSGNGVPSVCWPGMAVLIIGQVWPSRRGVPMQCLLAGCGRVNNRPGVARVGSGCPVDSWPGMPA